MNQKGEIDQRLTALMLRAQKGDRVAYTQLLEEVTPLLRQAIRYRRSFLQQHDIEDLVQDVLLSLHVVRASYDPGRPFLPWLMGIANNRIADGARRYARRAVNETTVWRMPETFPRHQTNIFEESYGDPEALRQAIRGLPPGQRDAIEMLKLRELSLKEASAASGMSIGALKIAVHRAVKALRAMLRKEA
jgi:RNA polymerase sigma factor (sigma-70 family)